MPDRKITELKVRLVRALKAYGTTHQLSQSEMALLLETTQPRMSNLYHEQYSKFSLDQLFKWVYTLNIETQTTLNI
jgi:predicted XRE-type DNA-binding protein